MNLRHRRTPVALAAQPPGCLQVGRLIVSAPGELRLGANFSVFPDFSAACTGGASTPSRPHPHNDRER